MAGLSSRPGSRARSDCLSGPLRLSHNSNVASRSMTLSPCGRGYGACGITCVPLVAMILHRRLARSLRRGSWIDSLRTHIAKRSPNETFIAHSAPTSYVLRPGKRHASTPRRHPCSEQHLRLRCSPHWSARRPRWRTRPHVATPRSCWRRRIRPPAAPPKPHRRERATRSLPWWPSASTCVRATIAHSATGAAMCASTVGTGTTGAFTGPSIIGARITITGAIGAITGVGTTGTTGVIIPGITGAAIMDAATGKPRSRVREGRAPARSLHLYRAGGGWSVRVFREWSSPA